jgi:iron complex transport system substrate-binding protein
LIVFASRQPFSRQRLAWQRRLTRRWGLARRRSLGALAIAALAAAAAFDDAIATESEQFDTTRIVSIGGSITETLFALEAGDRVVGADTTSLWPAEANRLPRVGYLRTLSAEGIMSLDPTLVLAGSDAGPPAALAQLEAVGVRLVVLPTEPSVAGAEATIRRLAEIVDERERGEQIVTALQADLGRAAAELASARAQPSVLFVINPPGLGTPLAAGAATAADAMTRLAGCRNSATAFEGYKPLSPEAAAAAMPEVVAVPSGTLARAGGEAVFLESTGLHLTPAGRSRRIVEVDPYVLSFGPRTGRAVAELARLLHEAAVRPSSEPVQERTSVR